MFKETREKIEMLNVNGIEQKLLKGIWKELVEINKKIDKFDSVIYNANKLKETIHGKSND